ncbi:MAG: hypothetical protein JKY31_10025 [Rhodobacteraceae bacterium]|nr:hypothetical protein [Paracoccaceae bacterium]
MNPLFRIWFFCGIFIAVALISIAIPLLPLGFSPDRWAMPDLFFALTVAWVLRMPNSAPLILVAALALLADAVLMRPVGLWALLIVVASELARMNERLIREAGILVETAFFVAILIVMVLIQNALLFLTFSGVYPLKSLLQFVMLSMICYPFITGFLHYILRVRGRNIRNLPDRLGKVG